MDLISTISNNANIMFNDLNYALDQVIDYKELLMKYRCAISEIETKFNVLNIEFNTKHKRNPISSIKSRLKSDFSIFEKLRKKNLDINIENIEEYVNDVAGVRVICNYIDDIYYIIDAFIKQDDIKLLKIKDYINNPKENGYRSVHLLVEVPVFFSDEVKDVKVEVQIRTIAMDFWASLEHQIRYKSSTKNTKELSKKLKECSENIFFTDKKMQEIRIEIDESMSEVSPSESLKEKIKKINNRI